MSRDRTVGDTFYIAFTTRAFATGIPTVLAGTPVISAYEDAGLTQITAGLTLGVDHDSVVGLNMITIVATGGNGFETGKDYNLVITTGTVGGVSVVGEVVGQFSLELSAAAIDLANGTDGLGAIKTDTAAILVDTADMQPKLGTPAGASISADILVIDTNVDQIETAVITNAAGADIAADIIAVKADTTAVLVDTADMQPKLGTPAGASISADIADVPTVAEFNARTLVAASYFDPAADTVATVTTVTTLTGHTAQTGDSFARLGAPAGASVSADILVIDNFVDGIETTLGVAGAGLTDITLNAASIDLVWDEPMAGHVTADTSGLVMNDWQEGGRLDVILDARMAEASISTTGGAIDTVTTTTTATNLTTNNDKTGYALSTAGDQSIADLVLPPTNTAFPNIEFLFAAASDHVTPVTGATGTAVTRSIDGGSFASGTGTLAEVGNGIYQYDSSAADMNGKVITFRFIGTGGTPGAPDDTFVTLVTSL